MNTRASSTTLHPPLFKRETDQEDLFPLPGGKNGKHHAPTKRAAIRDGLKAPSPVGKNFVLDTNVLIHDPDCVEHFADNHVCIPIEVLCELDRFKTEQSERGASARAVHRRLVEVFSTHPETANVGIPTKGGGTVRLVSRPNDKRTRQAEEELSAVLPGIDQTDHRLLLCTWLVRQENSAPTLLVTKDLNLQLKAHALSLPCEDYENDKVDHEPAHAVGPTIIDIKPNELQRFASSGSLSIPEKQLPEIAANEYVLLKAGEKRTMPARRAANGDFVRLRVPESIRVMQGTPIRPLNLGQQCFMDALLNPDISLVTCYGQAGTGKTLLAVASALHATFEGAYGGVTVSRPVVPLGDTLGFLPGSLEEKLHPWLHPIYDALEFLLAPDGKKKGRKPAHKVRSADPNQQTSAVQKVYQPMIDSGLIEIEALCYIRGRSIPNRFFILDEAQQLTPLEAKTIVTRMASGSKLVLIGDPEQIDNPYVDRRSNGLVYTRDRLRNHACSAHVTLERGERSELAEAGAKLM